MKVNLQGLIEQIHARPQALTEWCSQNIPPPGKGHGCHPMLLTAANYAIAAGVTPRDAIILIETGVPKGSRPLQPKEVANAVARAAADVPCVISNDQVDPEAWAEFCTVRGTGAGARRSSPVNPDIIPDIAYALTNADKVIAGLTQRGRLPGGGAVGNIPTAEQHFRQPEGVPLPTDLRSFIRESYHAGQYLLIGDTQPYRPEGTGPPADGINYRRETKTVENWLAWLGQPGNFEEMEENIPQMMFNPHCGEPKASASNPDSMSFRSKECFIPGYTVLESDNLPLQRQVEMARGMIDLGLPVAWVVFSGSKSVHVVLRVTPDPQHASNEYRAFAHGIAKPIGYDPMTVYYSSYSRTPFVKAKEDRERQNLLYWNGNVKPMTFVTLSAKLASAGGPESQATPSTNRPFFRRVKVKWKMNNAGELADPPSSEYMELGPGEFTEELEADGFHTTQDDTLVRIQNHVMDEVTEKHVKRYGSTAMMNDIGAGVEKVWLKTNHPMRPIEQRPTRDIRKWFTSRRTQYACASDPNLLSPVDVPRHWDTIDTCFIPDPQKIIVITARGFDIMDYGQLNGYVSRGSILPYPVNLDLATQGGCDSGVFAQFVHNIAGSDENYQAIRACIGYILHRYKDRRYAWAPVFIDLLAGIRGESAGGCGKSLFWNLVGRLRQMREISGKRYDNDNRFALQNVIRSDEFLLFDDIRKDHIFDGDFNLITEGMELERKGQTPIILPFEESPKIAYTSNSVPSDTSPSMTRRISIIELCDYYNQIKTPATEFGHQLGDDWREGSALEIEYHRHFGFCAACVRDYLSGKLTRPLPKGEYHYKQYMDMVNNDDILLQFFIKDGFPYGVFNHLDLTRKINESGIATGFGIGKYEPSTIKDHLDALRACFPSAGIPRPVRGPYLGKDSPESHAWEYVIPDNTGIQLAPGEYAPKNTEQEIEDLIG